jgi:drug/metabolite transporter (DMT)-like permease
MTLIWLGALLVLAGVVFIAVQPLWGRLSGGRRLRSGKPSDTLEPQAPARGFGIKSNWPGLVLVAMGAVLLLVAATF